MLDHEECERTASGDDKPTGEAVLAVSGGWEHKPMTSEQAKQMLRYLRSITVALWMILIKLVAIWFLILTHK